jgi:uncharacterized membrane protein YuzA (DUF378 family)
MLGRHGHGRKDQPLQRVDQVAGAMIALGAINWGVVGATNFDPVKAVFGRSSARAIYGAIGASAAYALVRGRRLASH